MLSAVVALLLGTASTAPPSIRGMTVSCPGWGETWGTPLMGEAVRELAGLGVGWIALHPYGLIRKDGRVLFDDPATTDYLVRALPMIAAGGSKIFWNPHLAYWGTFEWRGAIEFGNDREAWNRFFTDYRSFIVAHARFAQANRIPLFSVGIEYEQTVGHEKEWRSIIAAVRAVYRGQITYAANWDGIERVPFWDAVDLIGVQAYFPLASGDAPVAGDLVRAWQGVWQRLAAVSKKHENKKILFTEIGYARAKSAAKEPWVAGDDDDENVIALRSRLFDVAFEQLDHPLLAGAFWWKWIPGTTHWDRDFSMRDAEAIRALTAHWKK